MAVEIVELQAPIGGLRRDAGHQAKPPFYFEDGVNVRGFDVLENRGRIGSRPGLAKAFSLLLGTRATGTTGTTNAGAGTTFDDAAVADWATLGIVAGTDLLEVVSGTGVTAGSYPISAVAAGSLTLSSTPGVSGSSIVYKIGARPVRLANVVRTLQETSIITYRDEFDGSAMGAGWTFPAWTLTSFVATPGGPVVNIGSAFASDSQLRVAVEAVQTPGVATNAFREISALWRDGSASQRCYLCLDMDNTTPDPSVGGIMALFVEYASHARDILLYVNGILVTTTSAPQNSDATEIVRMTVGPDNVVKIWAKNVGAPSLSYMLSSYTPAGTRFGLGIRAVETGSSVLSWFQFAYTNSAAVSPSEAAIFSANSIMYREAPAGTLVADVTMNTQGPAADRRIFAATRLQKLYIADYGVRVSGTAGATNTAGTAFDDVSVSDWSVLGISTTGDMIEIISGTNVNVGVYSITAVAAGNVTVSPATNAAPSTPGVISSAIRYRVLRQVKILDMGVNPPTLSLAPAGTIGSDQYPIGNRSVTLWGDRLVWCNNMLSPHGWYMSAAGYPDNYNYGDDTLGVNAAVTDTQSEFAGLLGEPLVTTIPINDDLLVFACRTSFYVLRGNPLLGGVLDAISREIGIVDIGAWCRTPDGKLYVMTLDGLYEVSLDGAIPVSRDVIPKELLGLTDDLYDVNLAYDVSRRGIIISAVGKQISTISVHYFWHQPTGAFFPEQNDQTQDATAMMVYQPGGVSTPTALWGCRDGYVRKFEDMAEDDDGTDFNSFVLYGPLRLGRSDYDEGYLHEIVCVLDVLSGDVTLSVHGGHTAQAAKSATARYSTTMTAGRNRNRWPRLRYGVVYIKVTGTPGSQWVMENLTVTRERAGKLLLV